MSTKRLLGIGIFLAVMAIVLVQVVPKTTPSAPTVQAASSTPLIFQPEAQMLSQAINPQGTAIGEDTGPSTAPPDAAPATTTPYVYDPSICTHSSVDPFICLASYYKMTTATYGVNIAVQDIKERYTQNSEVASQCHPLMHIIGNVAASLYPTISDAYLHGDNFCWSGYYHGVLEGVVFKIGLQKLPSVMNTICADIPGKASYSFDYFNCVHGIGHGVMELENDDVFKSLNTCDILTGNWEEESSYGGVFMENIINFDHDGTSDFLKKDDLLYPCDAVDAKYKGQCYLGQTSYALQETNYDFAKIFALCATVAAPYRDICDQSMGRDGANQASHQAQATMNTCWIATDPEDRANCVIGAAKEIVSYYHSDVQAKAFCNVLDDADKATCLSTVTSYYTSF